MLTSGLASLASVLVLALGSAWGVMRYWRVAVRLVVTLDPAGMADMRATIRRLAEQGRTVLLSSHLLDEVQQICDRVGVISRGRLATLQTIGELGGAGCLRVIADPLARPPTSTEPWSPPVRPCQPGGSPAGVESTPHRTQVTAQHLARGTILDEYIVDDQAVCGV